jgi:hypothetical protein
MDIASLVRYTREDFLDDTVEDYLWNTAQLTRFANEAVKQACIRAPLLKKSKTISVVADTADYTIESTVRQIYVAKLDLGVNPLIQETDEGLSLMIGSNWRTRTGTPTHYVRLGKKLRLYPIPLVNDTLVMSTSNIPDDDFDLEDDIDPTYHEALAFWIAYKAFMFPDKDTYNPVKAADYLAMFNSAFGDSHTAKYDEVSFNTPTYVSHAGGRIC